jgi:hypothetical protein
VEGLRIGKVDTDTHVVRLSAPNWNMPFGAGMGAVGGTTGKRHSSTPPIPNCGDFFLCVGGPSVSKYGNVTTNK